MRVCLISKNFWPAHKGGAEVYMYEIFKRIKEEHEVKVLTYDDVDFEEAEVIRLPKIHYLVRGFLFSVIAGMKCRFGDYDVVHVNGYWADFSSIFAKNVVLTIHDVGFLEEGGVLNGIRKFLCNRAMNSADKVLTVSNKTRDEIVSNFGISEDDMEVIPNGIDLSKYEQEVKEDIRKKYNIGDKWIVLSVGRFARNKGYEYLIDAVKELDDTYLIIAGAKKDEKYFEELKDKLGDKGLLLNDITEEEKLSLYKGCDIYCQPSVAAEGFGITILEAMAAGKPVVVTDVFRDIGLVPEEYMVRKRDEDALRKKIVEISEGDYRNVGEEMRGVAECYSWDTVVSRIGDVYEEITS